MLCILSYKLFFVFHRMANFEGIDAGGVVGGKESASGINQYVNDRFDRSLTWDDVKWLVAFTKLPVIAKGVLRPDDAIKAIECGCKGVLVSNHGARQVDTVPATVGFENINLSNG